MISYEELCAALESYKTGQPQEAVEQPEGGAAEAYHAGGDELARFGEVEARDVYESETVVAAVDAEAYYGDVVEAADVVDEVPAAPDAQLAYDAEAATVAAITEDAEGVAVPAVQVAGSQTEPRLDQDEGDEWEKV